MRGDDVRGRASYAQVKVALSRLLTFTGSSMSARWERDSEGRRTYVVRSYRTPLAGHTPAQTTADGTHHAAETWLNGERYSHTTSRHQSLTRCYLPGANAAVEIGARAAACATRRSA